MKRRLSSALIALATALGLGLAAAGPAAAIRYGEPDNGRHPYVGLLIAYVWVDLNADGQQTDNELLAGWQCTGTQLDADTFVTAGHCVDGAVAGAIWFGDDEQPVRASQSFFTLASAIDPANPHRARAHSRQLIAHPEFDAATPERHDVAVVQLTAPLTLPRYAKLPARGYWDVQLAAKNKDRNTYDVVGYGRQRSAPPAAAHRIQDDWVKQAAHPRLIGNRQFNAGAGNDAYVVLTNNASTGGTCFGDSGGPTLIAGTDTVAAIISFGMNVNCGGTSGMYRIDTPDDLAFLGRFVR